MHAGERSVLASFRSHLVEERPHICPLQCRKPYLKHLIEYTPENSIERAVGRTAAASTATSHRSTAAQGTPLSAILRAKAKHVRLRRCLVLPTGTPAAATELSTNPNPARMPARCACVAACACKGRVRVCALGEGLTKPWKSRPAVEEELVPHKYRRIEP